MASWHASLPIVLIVTNKSIFAPSISYDKRSCTKITIGEPCAAVYLPAAAIGFRILAYVPEWMTGLYAHSGASFHNLNYKARWLTPLLSCRGFCSRHPNYIPMKKIDYARGMKVCITCDRAVFVGMAGAKCPCCKKSLRTRPQYHGAKGRMVRMASMRSSSSHLGEGGYAEDVKGVS